MKNVAPQFARPATSEGGRTQVQGHFPENSAQHCQFSAANPVFATWSFRILMNTCLRRSP